MTFFKKEIHYLGHLILVSGIQPLPKKLESIHNMPKPRSPKEIKKFLGLTGYYRKFVPRFSDMARPLTKLLAHDCEFKWTNQCDNFFQMLKDTLCSAPILKYPDTNKLYMLYTDARKYREPHIDCGWEIDYHGPPRIICQWIVSWQSIKLGCINKRSICYIYVC